MRIGANIWRLTFIAGCLALSAAALAQLGRTQPTFSVNGKFGLSSFVALTDGHLLKLADALQVAAGTVAARSARWQQVKGQLSQVAKTNAPAALWFALPNGSYWTLDQGKVNENLRSRPYFPRLLARQRVVGDMVVSKSTGKSVAIVAVPILRADRSVAGVLGASVYLDRLSAIVRREMGLDDSVIFFTFDSSPLLGMVWDPSLILVNPFKLGEPVERAFREMISRKEGTVTYTFRGDQRTVLYRKSALTGWWYGFGIVRRT